MMSMQVNEDKIIDAIAGEVVSRLMPELETLVKNYYQPDKGLNQQEAADLLGCGRETLMKWYFYQPGFPHFMKGTQIAFSQKALEKWMADNQVRA